MTVGGLVKSLFKNWAFAIPGVGELKAIIGAIGAVAGLIFTTHEEQTKITFSDHPTSSRSFQPIKKGRIAPPKKIEPTQQLWSRTYPSSSEAMPDSPPPEPRGVNRSYSVYQRVPYHSTPLKKDNRNNWFWVLGS